MLSPREAKKKTLEEAQAQIDMLEQHIDKHLSENFAGGRITVSIPSNNWKPGVIQAIMTRYKEAGWAVVEHHSEQREGEWFEFKEECNP